MKKLLMMPIAIFLACAAAGCGSEPEAPPGSSEKEPDAVKQMEDISFCKDDFEGKHVVIYGDSITFGAATSSPGTQSQVTWTAHLSRALGFTYTTFAANGAHLNYVTAKRVAADKVSGAEEIAKNGMQNGAADYAIIFLGHNDSRYSCPIGTDTDAPSSLEQIYSYKGAIRWCTEQLKGQNPAIKVIFLTPIWQGNLSAERLEPYREAIRTLSGPLGYYYADVGGLFGEEDLGTLFASDLMHLNDEGQKAFAEALEETEIVHTQAQ